MAAEQLQALDIHGPSPEYSTAWGLVLAELVLTESRLID